MILYMACCMTVRNCAPFLPKVLDNVDRLRTLFHDFVVIVAYDNCNDGTEQLLTNYQYRSSFPVYLLNGENTSPHRTVRIANARNRCLDKLDALKLDALKIDIHFMVDADDVNIEPWNITLIRYYLQRKDWDVMTFNRKNYYDIWALMYPPFQHHCWGFSNRSRDVVDYMQKDIQNKLMKCDELFCCQSAFNGFAIYRTSTFRSIRYNGEYKNVRQWITDTSRMNTLKAFKDMGILTLDESFVQCCEHLYYHLSVPHARIYISKYWIS